MFVEYRVFDLPDKIVLEMCFMKMKMYLTLLKFIIFTLKLINC